jgi:hypothetical protein
MKKINLSDMDMTMTTNEAIDFMFDNKIDCMVNNLTTLPNIEYGIDDLLTVWDNFKFMLCGTERQHTT